MEPGSFDRLFKKISDLLTLEIISEEKDFEQNFPKRHPDTPIWDTIDVLQPEGYIDISRGRYASYKNFYKGPVRILFFILISEFESRLFRISEWLGRDINELNDQNLNNLISNLLNDEMYEQREYKSRSDFKEDLKAISSFRNIIVHINKKLENNVDHNTLIKRKSQILKLLNALQQILDGMEIRYERLLNNLSEKDFDDLGGSIGDLEDTLKEIYVDRKLRNLTGENSILTRTLGDNFVGPNDFSEKYFDERRGLSVKTEFAETIEALDVFDENSSGKNETSLYLSYGDLLVQRKIVELYHKNNPLYGDVVEKLDGALVFLSMELKKRGLDLNLARRLTEIKYGSRLWLMKNGFIVKDKKLEHNLCLEELERLKIKKGF